MKLPESEKLKVLEEGSLVDYIKLVRAKGKTVALCHGVFDLLHPGHLAHFQEASQLADILLVSITADKFVNKGPGRPLFDEALRAKTLSAIDVVDAVIISRNETALEIINLVKPDFYVKGEDYFDQNSDVTGKIKSERKAIETQGGKIHFTKGFTSSSSKIINLHFSKLSSSTQDWITRFRKEGGAEQVSEYLEKLSKLRPLVIGELIIDQYTNCHALSKSSKYPLLAFQLLDTSFLPGGSLAIANNCSSWTSKAYVVSFASSKDERLNSVKNKINSGINLRIIDSATRPTILKHRYVDLATNTRLFEYYDFEDSSLCEEENTEIKNLLRDLSGETDLIIVSDYGHGLFSKSIINQIEELGIFFAVNTQANAGNRGYNTISKYSHANLISLNGAELQLELRNRSPKYNEIVPQIIDKMGASYAVLTLGAEGLMIFCKDGNVETVPAFAQNLVDKVGAGDAVFAMSSLLAKIGAPLKVIGFLSNLVAAHEVTQLGHQTTLSTADLLKQTKSILG
jgi:rfaE bifunctional protein kinase chain/domain/rfaE bifunctional protein nucleotidyltransferase chain/domain